MEFKAANFIINFPYLIKGVIGTFVALGAIALVTMGLNALTAKKNK